MTARRFALAAVVLLAATGCSPRSDTGDPDIALELETIPASATASLKYRLRPGAGQDHDAAALRAAMLIRAAGTCGERQVVLGPWEEALTFECRDRLPDSKRTDADAEPDPTASHPTG